MRILTLLLDNVKIWYSGTLSRVLRGFHQECNTCLLTAHEQGTVATESMVHFGISKVFDRSENFIPGVVYHIFSPMHIILRILMLSIILRILLNGK